MNSGRLASFMIHISSPSNSCCSLPAGVSDLWHLPSGKYNGIFPIHAHVKGISGVSKPVAGADAVSLIKLAVVQVGKIDSDVLDINPAACREATDIKANSAKS